MSNLKSQILLSRFPQPFRARADDPSGHAVWPAMRTGENTSAHAKTLPSLTIPPSMAPRSDNVLLKTPLACPPARGRLQITFCLPNNNLAIS